MSNCPLVLTAGPKPSPSGPAESGEPTGSLSSGAAIAVRLGHLPSNDPFDRRLDPPFTFDGYDGEYFTSLCERVLRGRRQGVGHVIRSAGTLGGGNHFVEFSKARESGDYWLVIHSGSRYLGAAVADHWQDRARTAREADAIRAAIEPTADVTDRLDPVHNFKATE